MAGMGKTLQTLSEEPVPQFKDYTRITQSFLVEDNHQLPYEPYINEKEANAGAPWRKKLRNAYGDLPDPTSTRRDEQASRLRDILLQILEEVGLCIEEITSDIFAHVSFLH